MSTRLRRALGTTAMLLVLALVGWRLWPRTEAPAEAAAPRADADGSLRLAPSQVTGLGIALARTAAAASVPLPGLAAQAQAPMDASQQVASPWPGTVVALLVDEGVDGGLREAFTAVKLGATLDVRPFLRRGPCVPEGSGRANSRERSWSFQWQSGPAPRR